MLQNKKRQSVSWSARSPAQSIDAQAFLQEDAAEHEHEGRQAAQDELCHVRSGEVGRRSLADADPHSQVLAHDEHKGEILASIWRQAQHEVQGRVPEEGAEEDCERASEMLRCCAGQAERHAL